MLGYSAARSSKTDDNLQIVAANLNYISACQEDPDLKSFDAELYELTSKLIASFSARVGQPGNLSLDSLTDVCGCLLDVNQKFVTFITDSKEDVLKNEELKSVVDLYFESTTKTLNLFNMVDKSVKKAKFSQLNIRIAIKLYETESRDTDFGGNMKKKKYAETLEQLNKIKAMEDPFGDEFAHQYESIYQEQVVLLDKFHEMQMELKKKKKNVKKMKLVNAVFATAMASVLATSIGIVAGAAIGLHVYPVAIGLIRPFCLTVRFATKGISINDMLTELETGLQSKISLLQVTENSTKFNINAMQTIKNLVEQLITSISYIMDTVDVAVRRKEEETIKVVMQEIIKNVDEFSDKIEEVGEGVVNCSKSVNAGKANLMEYITKSISPKGK